MILLATANLSQAQPRSLELSPIQWQLYALRAHRELGLTKEEVKTCKKELRNYKRDEKQACYEAWEEVKDYPKTEIALTVAKWIKRREQARKEQIQLIRNRIKPELRERYNEILFQCCLYFGDFFLAAEVGRLELDDEVVERLRKEYRSKDSRTTFELQNYRQMVEADMLRRELGKNLNLGAPFRAAIEIRDGGGTVYAPTLFPHHVAFGQLVHTTVARELALSREQLSRLRGIGQKHGIRERLPEDNPYEDYAIDAGFGSIDVANSDPDAESRKSKRIVQELSAVLSEGQQERFRQIQAQALIASGHRQQALNLFGINPQRDHERDARIDRVKKAISTDYRLMKAREALGSVVSLERIDRAMGRPSFEFLDSQSIGFGRGMSRNRDRNFISRSGPAFQQLAKQAGRWYADAIEEDK